MIGRARHLHEDRLFECYLTGRTGEPADPHVAEHLADCDVCAGRYIEIVRFMDEISAQADAETDAVFTPEQLRAQEQQIARRIEHIGHAARVISFPRPFSSDRPRASTPSHTRSRWIATAAASGLFIGVALGASFEWQRHMGNGGEGVAAPRPIDAPARLIPTLPVASDGNTPSPDVAADDAFLSDLDVRGERPQTRELMLIDALTPHVREIRYVR